jgi:putative DNA primase/helicase
MTQNFKPAQNFDPNHQAFQKAIAATGLNPPDNIVPGEIVRFPGLNKGPSNRSAWCKLFEDGLGGVFGDYSSSMNSTWQASRDKKLTEADKRAFEQKAQAARHEREQQHAIDQARSAAMAKRRWDEATPCESFQ